MQDFSWKSLVHHTDQEEKLQNELVSSVSEASARESVLKVEVQNYDERMRKLEIDFFVQLTVNTNANTERNRWLEYDYLASLCLDENEKHARIGQLENDYLSFLCVTENDKNGRLDQLNEQYFINFVHHINTRADLQNELIALSAAATLKEIALRAEIKNYDERMGKLENDFFAQLAINTNANIRRHEKLESDYLSCLCVVENEKNAKIRQLESDYLLSMCISENDKNARLDQLSDSYLTR